MIHCTTYTDNQGNPLGYFMEFVNVKESKIDTRRVKPVIFSKEYQDYDTMIFFAQGYSENYTVGIVYKTVIDNEYI